MSASQEDNDIKMAMLYTLSGWPKYKLDVPQSLREFFHIRNELSATDGLLTHILVKGPLSGESNKQFWKEEDPTF